MKDTLSRYPYFKIKTIRETNKALDQLLGPWKNPDPKGWHQYVVPTKYGNYSFSLERDEKKQRLYGIHGRFDVKNHLTGQFNSKWNHYYNHHNSPSQIIFSFMGVLKSIGFDPTTAEPPKKSPSYVLTLHKETGVFVVHTGDDLKEVMSFKARCEELNKHLDTEHYEVYTRH